MSMTYEIDAHMLRDTMNVVWRTLFALVTFEKQEYGYGFHENKNQGTVFFLRISFQRSNLWQH
jgi:hypothetical protein